MQNNDRTDLQEKTKRSNPFVFDRPVEASDLFIGRERALSWVSDVLQNALGRPMRIDGVPGIGQTTFLLQVQKQAKLHGIAPIYVNMKRIPLASFSDFLWAFGKIVVDSLTDTGLSAPILEKRMLVLRPWQAFRQSFWQPFVEENRSHRFLLILDNFERLTTKRTTSEANRAYRQYLYELTEQNPNILLLTSLASRTEAYDAVDLAPFHQSIHYRIRPFSEQQSFDLIRQNRMLYIRQATASSIYSLTRGHPADLQRLCHAIFERMQGYGFKVITVADVVSALRDQLKPTDFRQPVYHQSRKLLYPKEKRPV